MNHACTSCKPQQVRQFLTMHQHDDRAGLPKTVICQLHPIRSGDGLGVHHVAAVTLLSDLGRLCVLASAAIPGACPPSCAPAPASFDEDDTSVNMLRNSRYIQLNSNTQQRLAGKRICTYKIHLAAHACSTFEQTRRTSHRHRIQLPTRM